MLLKIRLVARLGPCVAGRANYQGLLLLELCRGRRPLGVVRRVVRRSESGCGAVGGEHGARVPHTLVWGLSATGFLRGAFPRVYEPINLLTTRPRPDDSLPDSTDDAPPPLHTHTAQKHPPPQRPAVVAARGGGPCLRPMPKCVLLTPPFPSVARSRRASVMLRC